MTSVVETFTVNSESPVVPGQRSGRYPAGTLVPPARALRAPRPLPPIGTPKENA